MTMTETPKEQCQGVNLFAKLASRFGSNHGSNHSREPSDGSRTPADTTAKSTMSIDMESAFSPFEIADDLEQGLAAEAVMAKNATSPARPKEPFRRCCIFHVVDPADEFHLLSETGDMLLTAKFFRRERRVEIFLPEGDKRTSPQSTIGRLKRSIPAFAMTHSENTDNWVLTQTCCEHCVQRPKHVSCDFLGKAQQIAFIQHSRRKAGEALVHHVDIRIPTLFSADTQSKVWCPVALGRELSDRSPAQGRSLTPGKSRPLCQSPSSFRDYSSEEETQPDPLQLATKMPTWDAEVESLVLNFKDRTVQSSAMNFMLCADPGASQRLVMQHAKLSANTYCLDFRHPLSNAQAFAIALTALLWD